MNEDEVDHVDHVTAWKVRLTLNGDNLRDLPEIDRSMVQHATDIELAVRLIKLFEMHKLTFIGPTAEEARRREATRDLIEELERKYFLREQRFLIKQCSEKLKKKLYAKHHAQSNPD